MPDAPAPGAEDLAYAVAAQLHQRISRLGKKLQTPFDLDDLIVDDDTRAALVEIAAAARERRKIRDAFKLRGAQGISVLFSGHPGVGKTMSAHRDRQRLGLEHLRGRSVAGRLEVDRRDREEPRPTCSTPPSPATSCCCSTRPTRCSASARPTSRRQQRSLRQHGDQLPAAAARAVRRPRDPDHQPGHGDRPGVQAPVHLRREFPFPDARDARASCGGARCPSSARVRRRSTSTRSPSASSFGWLHQGRVRARRLRRRRQRREHRRGRCSGTTVERMYRERGKLTHGRPARLKATAQACRG